MYAWGVLLWEMLTGMRAWAGLQHAQILCHVAVMKRSLGVPEGTPAALADLLTRSLAAEPQGRPTFGEIVDSMQLYLQKAR